MAGLEILNTTVTSEMASYHSSVFSILMIIGVAFILATLLQCNISEWNLVNTITIIIGLLFLVGSLITYSVADRIDVIEHEVLISDDEIVLSELLYQYEITDINGKIYTIKKLNEEEIDEMQRILDSSEY